MMSHTVMDSCITLPIQEKSRAEMKRKSIIRMLMSLAVVVSVAIAWALSTQFSQTALKIDPDHFNAPYCMMWFNTCFMIVCYPVFLLYVFIFAKGSSTRIQSVKDAHESALTVFGSGGLTLYSFFIYITPFLIFWIGANYTYARALITITASVATSISSCNAAIVYFLAIIILRDKFIPFKLLAVLFAVAGVVVMSLDGKMSAEWEGILLAVSSATSAAIYKVLFKRIVGDASLPQVSLFMSCLGLLNIFINWIPPVVLASTKTEILEFGYIPWWPIIGTALLSLLFNFLINFGIALLHPLVVSVGMLTGIPLNTAIDVIFRHVHLSWYFIGGTVLIIISFILIILPYDLLCYRNQSITEDIETLNSTVSVVIDERKTQYDTVTLDK